MPDDTLGIFQAELGRRQSQYNGAVLTAAVDLERGSPKLITATLVFVANAELEDEERRYHGLHLIRKVMSVKDGKSLAETVFVHGPEARFTVQEYTFSPSGSPSWASKRSSNESRFGIRSSSTEYYAYLSDSAYGPNDVLAAEGLPSYPNAREAVMDWFGQWESIDSWRGIFIVLPEYRAKIDDVVLEGQFLRATIGRGHRGVPTERYRIAYFAREGPRVSKGEVELERDAFEVNLEIAPTVLSVSLLAEGADVVDWRYVNLERGSRPPGISIRLPGLQLEMMLQEGEGLYTEFKREVREGEWDRTAQSVVAFANAKGGTIVIGVSDQGEVIGVPGSFPSQDDLARALREWVEPDLDCRMERWPVRGKTVVIISVLEGTSKPYFHKERGPLIRRGSNNLLMRRVDVIDLARK